MFRNIPIVTRNLLIINVLVYLLASVVELGGKSLTDWGALHFFMASDFHVYQFITYQFLHGGFTHLFFNMFSLWMFGMLLERVMGAKRYLFFYLTCGIGAGLVQELVWHMSWESVLATINNVPTVEIENAIKVGAINANFLNEFYNNLVTVGASGAVFGILLAFGMIFPNMPMYIFFIPIPIKAKWMVIGYGAIELFFGITGHMDHVAHFAHLGGMLFAFIILMYWRKKGVFNNIHGLY